MITSCTDLHITDQEIHPNLQHSPLQIETNIHQLLQQEMQAIQNGMMALVPAIASGDWNQVAEIGRHIESSYLLKKKLSKAQRHSLHNSFPAEFIKQDQAFHRSAGMLAHAAEHQNAEIVSFYYYQLSKACVDCHSEFALKRFPGLKSKNSQLHH